MCNSSDGNWGSWTVWTACSVTCGSGTQTRTWNCDNPPPSYGGATCTGTETDSQSCSSEACYQGNLKQNIGKIEPFRTNAIVKRVYLSPENKLIVS